MKLIILFTGLASLLVKLFIDLPLMVAGLFAVAIALPFSKDNHLPKWAEWCWGNKDHGNDGGSFWIKRSQNWPNWLRCYWWLAVRNPTFNWSKYVIGVAINNYPAATYGNTNVDEDDGITGWYFSVGEMWEFRFVGFPYKLFGRDFCVKLRFGWKIQGKNIGETAQFCFVPNPVCAFTPLKIAVLRDQLMSI